MANKQKVTEEQLQKIREDYESGEYSNIALSNKYAYLKITEKNIRDWIKRYVWTKGHKPKIKPIKAGGLANRVRANNYLRKKRVQPVDNSRKSDGMVRSLIEIEDGTRFSAEELNQVMEQVIEMVIGGFRKIQIRAYIMQKWAVKYELFVEMHHHAMKAMADSIENNMKARFAFHIEARLKLYRKLYDSKKYKDAHIILMDLARIEGMYPKEPLVSINTINGNVKKVTKMKVPTEYLEAVVVKDED